MTDYRAVIFDLGGVVLGWAPERAYEQVLDPIAAAAFMDKIDFPSWNQAHDAGQRFAVGEAALLDDHPGEARAVRAYREHFPQTLTGMITGTAAVIAELQQAGVDLVGLTNWSDETFPHAEQRFGILRRLREILVSGAEQLAKPDPAIFILACQRFGLDPATTIFIDDSAANVAAAETIGLTALRFSDAGTLRVDLQQLGLLGEPTVITEPVFHLALAADWATAEETGSYPWSTRNRTHDAEGYVHCSFARQVPTIRNGPFYADLRDDQLVLLVIDPGAGPWLVEDLAGEGDGFPHLYAEIEPRWARVHPGFIAGL